LKIPKGKSETVNRRTRNDQKTKDKGTNNDYQKHYKENKRLSTTNPTNNWGWTKVLLKAYQFLLH